MHYLVSLIWRAQEACVREDHFVDFLLAFLKQKGSLEWEPSTCTGQRGRFAEMDASWDALLVPEGIEAIAMIWVLLKPFF